MDYTNFNQYKVSKLALGTVQLGMDYGIANHAGAPNASEAAALLDASYAAGITSFDTSPTYGSSEDILGGYLSGKRRDELLIVSKFKYNTDLVFNIDRVWQEVKLIVEQSLLRLNLSVLPLVLYHKGASESMDQVKARVPVLLDRLKNEGLIAHGGISLYASSEADALLNDDSFEALQIPLNVLDQRIVTNGTLQKLHENGKLIMIRSVFLQGLFFRDPAGLSGILGQAVPYLNRLNQLAKQYDLTLAELIFAFVRDLPQADSLVIGAENRAQVAANVRLLNAPALVPALRVALQDLSLNAPTELITPALWN
jgi:aryl-alcohol dehydrogenase-like predicted oxidoreductase